MSIYGNIGSPQRQPEGTQTSIPLFSMISERKIGDSYPQQQGSPSRQNFSGIPEPQYQDFGLSFPDKIKLAYDVDQQLNYLYRNPSWGVKYENCLFAINV